MNPALQLGPFRLEAPIGEGGMGVVWRGMHQGEGFPVAVKVLGPRAAGRKAGLSAFRGEVRAVAALDHPNVVTVFDQGKVSEAAAQASGGRLVQGTPYLVMELLSGGSLRPQCGRLDWDQARAILRSLLYALAHAHARGVIHRDIKPENVLLDSGGRPVLTDFGIAEALREERLPRKGGRRAGTPAYMAPEQITGRWRDQGPWTDLYALGCLAHDLLTGSPPFSSAGGEPELMAAHLTAIPPPVFGRCAVPEGLDAWLGRLLEKSPQRRFRRAADAAIVLDGLGAAIPPSEPEHTHPVAASRVEAPKPHASLDASFAATVPIEFPESPSSSVGPKGRPPRGRPVLPATWAVRDLEPRPRRLAGAGLALHGLRPLPLVGRRSERDRLWSALASVIDEELPRVVLLQGPSGVGKSHLARWLCERAEEVGCATVLEAFHGPIPGEAHGIWPMLTRALRLEGTSRREARERVLGLLAPVDDEGIGLSLRVAELLTEAGEGEASESLDRHAGRRRLATVASLLQELSRERPIVMLLDDGQWGLEALGLALHLLQDQANPAPRILVLVTISLEALAEQQAATAAVEELGRIPEVESLSLGPLGADEQSELLRVFLGLSDELAARVERRAAGNPLFAEALIGDWAQRGLLVQGADGYSLSFGAPVDLPASVQELWGGRIERALLRWPEADGEALEIAAVLGGRVLASEWEAACEVAGLKLPLDLAEELEAARLVRSLPGEGSRGWTFVHGMVREALEARAARHGRLALRHRQCARLLAEGSGIDIDDRVGSHLLAAGDLEEAIEPLTRAARRRLMLGDARLAAAILGDLERIFESLGISQADVRRTSVWRIWSRRERLLGDCEAAASYARRAVEGDEVGHRPGELALSLIELGRSTREAGRPKEAEVFLLRAVSAAEAAKDEDVMARCRHELAWLCLQAARFEEADGHLEVAAAGAVAAGRLEDFGDCAYARGWLAIGQDRLADARRHLVEAQEIFKRADSRIGVARSETSLGDVARLRGDLEDAERWCRLALASYRRLGNVSVVVPLANLSLVLLELGRWAEAKESFETALSMAMEDGREILAFLARTGLIAACAGADELESCPELLLEVEAADQSGMIRHVDVARTATLAAKQLLRAGDLEQARRMAKVAKAQWLALGRAAEAAGVDESVLSLCR